MKVHLLQPKDRNVYETVAPFPNDLFEDLQLDSILQIMAKQDRYVYQSCRRILLEPLTDLSVIQYRQKAIEDVLQNKKSILELYVTVAEVVTDLSNYKDRLKKRGNPSAAIRVIDSIEMLDILAVGLEKLKAEITNTYGHFHSENFREFYDTFLQEFDSNFMQMIHQKRQTLQALQVGGEIQISAQLGAGLKSERFLVNSVAEYQSKHKFDKIESLFSTLIKKDEIRINYDDLRLSADCKDLENAGLLHIANYFDSFSREIQRLFESLRSQLAFLYGCANLHTHMSGMTFPVCFPEFDVEQQSPMALDLYDLSLAIKTLRTPVTNRLSDGEVLLYLVTGTNQGGKTSFLRSVGTAQLMAQSGLFVPAGTFRTCIYRGIYTHFIRNEDITMTSGKLEEELSRLSKIIDRVKTGSLILLNESFATTSEREGANIAEEIVRAFYDNGITCFFVTHIYAFVKKAYEEAWERTRFLQAQRLDDGTRTFRILPGEPSSTGYGMELYRQIIGEAGAGTDREA